MIKKSHSFPNKSFSRSIISQFFFLSNATKNHSCNATNQFFFCSVKTSPSSSRKSGFLVRGTGVYHLKDRNAFVHYLPRPTFITGSQELVRVKHFPNRIAFHCSDYLILVSTCECWVIAACWWPWPGQGLLFIFIVLSRRVNDVWSEPALPCLDLDFFMIYLKITQMHQ